MRKILFFYFSVNAFIHSAVEILSYIILFHYISQHDNNIAKTVLKPSVIKSRNKANAVNLTGLILGWLMEVWYIILVGIVSLFMDRNVFRELSGILKFYEFYLIPLVQVHTSGPLKKFMTNSKNA